MITPSRSATLVPGMTDYVRETPEAIARAQRSVPLEARALVAAIPAPVVRIDIVGSGTSLHAGLAVRGELEERLGIETRVLTPSEYLTSSQTRTGRGTLLLGVSQTGRSTGTNQAMELARRRGAHAILVTGWPDSVGAASADAVLDIACGEEHVGARTKGYTATLHALLALGDALAGGDGTSPEGLPAALARLISRGEESLGAIADDFEEASSMWIVSYGPHMATAREAALKLVETVRVPILAYDVEEYMHGPYHCLEEDTRVVLIAPPGPGRERMERLLSFISTVTPHVLVLEEKASSRPGPGHRFLLEEGLDPRYTPLLSIPLFQLLAAELTWRRGREPGVSRYPDFHALLGSKTAPSTP